MRPAILFIDASITLQKVVALSLNKKDTPFLFARDIWEAKQMFLEARPFALFVSDAIESIDVAAFPGQVVQWNGGEEALPPLILVSPRLKAAPAGYKHLIPRPFSPAQLAQLVDQLRAASPASMKAKGNLSSGTAERAADLAPLGQTSQQTQPKELELEAPPPLYQHSPVLPPLDWDTPASQSNTQSQTGTKTVASAQNQPTVARDLEALLNKSFSDEATLLQETLRHAASVTAQASANEELMRAPVLGPVSETGLMERGVQEEWVAQALPAKGASAPAQRRTQPLGALGETMPLSIEAFLSRQPLEEMIHDVLDKMVPPIVERLVQARLDVLLQEESKES